MNHSPIQTQTPSLEPMTTPFEALTPPICVLTPPPRDSDFISAVLLTLSLRALASSHQYGPLNHVDSSDHCCYNFPCSKMALLHDLLGYVSQVSETQRTLQNQGMLAKGVGELSRSAATRGSRWRKAMRMEPMLRNFCEKKAHLGVEERS